MQNILNDYEVIEFFNSTKLLSHIVL